jgi:hypothetical protein
MSLASFGAVMPEILHDIRQWLELVYFVGGVVLAGAALYGLQQIRLMKRDMRIRSERAAAEKAIEYITRYTSHSIPHSNNFYQDCVVNELPSYDGPISDFTFASLPPQFVKIAKERFARFDSFLPALNELNAIASAFAYGVADEKIGFAVIGRTFCASVAHHYDLICVARMNEVCPHFESIVTLYNLWAPRISKNELMALRRVLDRQLTCVSARVGCGE